MMRAAVFLAALLVVAVLPAADAAVAVDSGRRDRVVVMTFENIEFDFGSSACPEGVVRFDVVSPAGAQVGTGSSCIQRVDGCDPFAVGCRQRAESIFTFALAGRDAIVVSTKLHEVVLDDDPFTLAQLALGKVVNGEGGLIGAGTLVFTPDGIESTLVYVLRLRGER
jgi:hypothetical protein